MVIESGTREIACHRHVLCSKSRYFASMCGQKSRFAVNPLATTTKLCEIANTIQESGAEVIRLHEDNPEALEALLKHL